MLIVVVINLISVCGTSLAQNETQQMKTNVLDSIMSLNAPVNISQVDEKKVVHELYGKESVDEDRGHLDLIALELEDSKIVYAMAQTKLQLVEKKMNESRRWSTQGFVRNEYYQIKAMELMQQSIYSTRIRINDTRSIRKKYSVDPIYDIAILYGSLMQIRLNMENIQGTIGKFDSGIKFKWYLVLYEKCLAASIDVDFLVQKMFVMVKETNDKMQTRESMADYDTVAAPPKKGGNMPLSDVDISKLNLDNIQKGIVN